MTCLAILFSFEFKGERHLKSKLSLFCALSQNYQICFEKKCSNLSEKQKKKKKKKKNGIKIFKSRSSCS